VIAKNLTLKQKKNFGGEWSRFDRSGLLDNEARRPYDECITVIPWDSLSKGATAPDMGCGTGQSVKLSAPRFGRLHCIGLDPALDVVMITLSSLPKSAFPSSKAGDRTLPANG